MKRLYVTIEDTTADKPTTVRLLAHDRIKAAKIARTNSIPWEEGPECHALLAYAAARRAGLTSADDFDAWLESILDYEITVDEPTGAVADPTRPTPGPGPSSPSPSAAA